MTTPSPERVETAPPVTLRLADPDERCSMTAQRSIDPAWWDRATWQGQPLRDLLAERAVGPVFRFLHSRGWSYAAIADATDLGAGRVSEIANHNRAVTSYDVLARIADGLQIPRCRMGLAYGDGSAGYGGSDPPDDHE